MATRSPSAHARPGIWPKFPKVRNFLAKFELGPIGAEEARAWEQDELPRLRRWAAGERFDYTVGPPGSTMELPYVLSSAASDLARVGQVHEFFAIRAALRGEAGWLERWPQAVAWQYRAWCFEHRWHRHALEEFERGIRPQKLRMLGLVHGLGACVGHCLALGWFDHATDLTRRILDGLDRDLIYDGGDEYGQRRTQHFVLRLVADWQGWPPRSTPRCAHDEPVFNTLVAQWRNPDAQALQPLLLEACDRHTHQCRYDNAKGEFFDLYREVWYVPFEILALLRLRATKGWANPPLDHPLMSTPLGQLQPPSPPWQDELLEGVVSRARREFSDL